MISGPWPGPARGCRRSAIMGKRPARRALPRSGPDLRGAVAWEMFSPGHGAVIGDAGPQLPLTCGIDEIEDCAWFSAEPTDAVPVIAAWIAVHSACDTFG